MASISRVGKLPLQSAEPLSLETQRMAIVDFIQSIFSQAMQGFRSDFIQQLHMTSLTATQESNDDTNGINAIKQVVQKISERTLPLLAKDCLQAQKRSHEIKFMESVTYRLFCSIGGLHGFGKIMRTNLEKLVERPISKDTNNIIEDFSNTFASVLDKN